MPAAKPLATKTRRDTNGSAMAQTPEARYNLAAGNVRAAATDRNRMSKMATPERYRAVAGVTTQLLVVS
jgi:hypothetical protein